ncbi:hypothetical protein ACIU1J_07045 [Azospirillum doebereinerae]|uniref:hypothetical protein n=1 Tax=Azospirillum doebereinerae TaxID=92933 RepID=UPI0038506B30
MSSSRAAAGFSRSIRPWSLSRIVGASVKDSMAETLFSNRPGIARSGREERVAAWANWPTSSFRPRDGNAAARPGRPDSVSRRRPRSRKCRLSDAKAAHSASSPTPATAMSWM